MQQTNTEYHMLHEILEQPQALAFTLGRYADPTGFLPETTSAAFEWLRHEKDLLIVASGSSRHAGLAAELMFEEIGGLHVDVEYASEYICRSEKSLRQSGVIVVSQSGETADTLAALRRAKSSGKATLAVTNVLHSSMANEADVFFPTLAGVEKAIPATKSFTTQFLALYLLSLLAAKARGFADDSSLDTHLADAFALPNLIEAQLPEWRERMEQAASRYRSASAFLFLGRGIHYPIVREGALKLKESSYITAEGYPGGELKHGPNALVSSSVPLVMLATVDANSPDSVNRYEKTLQLMRDMKKQGAEILAVATRGDREVPQLANFTVEVSAISEPLLALAGVIPLQLFSFFMAIGRGIDVDHPRNLVKSVTVE